MIVVMSIGLSSVASAGGIYDGIWAVDGDMNKLTSFHQSGATIVAFGMNNYDVP